MGRKEDPLAVLGTLPGVPEAVNSVRQAVDRVYGHRVMRRRSDEVIVEAALRGARGSAALAGADWPLEELRRRSDFSADDEARTVGAALRLTAEAGQLVSIWRHSPVQALARLHLVAAGGSAANGTVGRPRRAGEPIESVGLVESVGPVGGELVEPVGGELVTAVVPPDAAEVTARLQGLADLLIAGSEAPALVMAAVVHG